MNARAFVDHLPFWGNLLPAEQELVRAKAYVKNFEAGSLIQSSDKFNLGFVHILSGKVRAFVSSDEGREITLFFLEKGDSCILSAASVLRQIIFDTLVSSVTNTRILILPPQAFSSLLESNLHVKFFAYELIATRFSSVMLALQHMVFTRLDKRLARFLLAQRDEAGGNELHIKQTDIATHVNSVRVAVTRVLNQFASDGVLECRRGCIVLKNIAWLQKLAA